MNHPNLSDEVNANIAKSEIEGGVWLKMPDEWATAARADALANGNVLPIGKTLLVRTENSLYRIEKRAENEIYISGHAQFCPSPVRAYIHGSTWGGSMLKVGFIGRGMHLEFAVEGTPGTLLTSEILEITEAP